MSLRPFTVFQDSISGDVVAQPKQTRSNVMTSRSLSSNVANTAASSTELAGIIDKENVNPFTGEHTSMNLQAGKKRKTSVLVTKVQPPTLAKSKKDKDSENEPEKKKRKASTSTTKGKASTKIKASGSTRKSTSKRAGSRKVSPMPQLNEEDEVEKRLPTQVDIDSRCYELTVKPLADVSEAYEEAPIFETLAASPALSKAKLRTVKATSVEPEIRDYIDDPQALFSSTSTRPSLRSYSEAPEGRTFSTPERKQIYAAFTFSSPSGSSARLGKTSRSGSPSPSKGSPTELS